MTYRFGGFTVDPVRRLLFGPDGKPISLKSRVFDTLLYLVEHPGELLEKQTLLDAVWPRIVEENNLNQAISTLRRVLGEAPGEHRFIVTEPGRGYRFVARVDTVTAEPAASITAASAPAAAEMRTPAPSAPMPPAAVATKPRKRPSFGLPAALLALVVVGVTAWGVQRAAGTRWARAEAIPEVARLVDAGDFEAAFALAAEAKKRVSYDPLLERITPQFAATFAVTTAPAGATISVRGYDDLNGNWRVLGSAPLTLQVPRVTLRWRFEKPGYAPAERTTTAHDDFFDAYFGAAHLDVTLGPTDAATENMVLVPGGDVRTRVGRRDVALENLAAYFLDRFEVTNAEFKKFVDAGGYRDARYWDGLGPETPFDAAMRQFVDSTGQPGPKGWELGRYPNGEGNLPVTGVSRYEAAAYAKFRGKQVPTVYHWTKATLALPGLDSSFEASSVALSNFASAAPVAVGSRQGVGPFGTYDMHGNVREWIANDGGPLGGWVLGGGFEDPVYTFAGAMPADPFSRSPSIGFRLMRTMADAPLAANALAPVELARTLDTTVEPVADDVYEAYRAQYDYVPTDQLHASEPEMVETTDDWIKQRVVIDTVNGERMAVLLFIPHDAPRKAQALIYFPGYDRFRFRLPDDQVPPGYNALPLDWLVRSGRVLVAPTFQGSYARFKSPYDVRDSLRTRREWVDRRWDLGRTLDYLEQREDIDASKVGYLGFSAGGVLALPLLALEPRLEAAVLLGGGLPFDDAAPPETEPVNFVPRITLPVLMVNGRYDTLVPVDVAQKPLFDLLRTPAADKRYYALEGGHLSVPRPEVARLALDFLDCYLGPVEDRERVSSTECNRTAARD